MYAELQKSKSWKTRMIRPLVTLWQSVTGTRANRNRDCNQDSDIDREIAYFTKIITLNPDSVWALLYRGMAYEGKGEFDRAIADYEKIIAFRPKRSGSHYARGNAYYDKGDYDHAIADFDKAIALDPNYDRAYTKRGQAYARKGNKEQAIADLCKAFHIDPSDQDAKDGLRALGVAP